MPIKLTPEQVAREIARRNRIFTAASAAQKRVLLARDVVAQIKRKVFTPNIGNWVTIDNPLDGLGRVADDASLQQVLLSRSAPECKVCALGGLIASCVLFENKVTMKDYENSALAFDDFNNPIKDYFSASQLRLIELAFEGSSGWFGNEVYNDLPHSARKAHLYQSQYERTEQNDAKVFSGQALKAVGWSRRIKSTRKRLLAIMANIIENGGKFIP